MVGLGAAFAENSQSSPYQGSAEFQENCLVTLLHREEEKCLPLHVIESKYPFKKAMQRILEAQRKQDDINSGCHYTETLLGMRRVYNDIFKFNETKGHPLNFF